MTNISEACAVCPCLNVLSGTKAAKNGTRIPRLGDQSSHTHSQDLNLVVAQLPIIANTGGDADSHTYVHSWAWRVVRKKGTTAALKTTRMHASAPGGLLRLATCHVLRVPGKHAICEGRPDTGLLNHTSLQKPLRLI